MTDDVSIDRYANFTPIGSGGFSQVYKSWRADQDRFVAVKVLALGSEREIDRDAFVAECRAMGAVSSHPNVVTAFDNGFTNEGYPFIAMELCRESLADRIKAAPDRRLEPVEVLSIGAKIFSALGRAHDKGILHRDLKPQNILFTEWDLPALTDFGIAALASDAQSQQSWALSRHYAAPEVINDEPHTVACDIYSLGATLYTALAGRRPFSVTGDNDPIQLEARITGESPPPLDPAWVPDLVADEIMRLLAKHPRDRPSTATDASRRLLRLHERLSQGTVVLLDTGEASDGDVTEVKNADAVDEDPGASGEDFTSSQATGRREVAPAKPTEVDAPKNRRRLWATAVLLAVLVGVAVVAVVGRDGSSANQPPSPSPISVPPTVVVTVLTAPSAPTEVQLSDTDEGWLLSWAEVEGADRYRIDYSAGDRQSLLTSETEIVLATDDDATCVTVVAVNANGRLSTPSRQICTS